MSKENTPADLTGILDFAKKLKDRGELPTHGQSDGSSNNGLPDGVEDKPIEKIEHFESIDELPLAPEVADPYAADTAPASLNPLPSSLDSSSDLSTDFESSSSALHSDALDFPLKEESPTPSADSGFQSDFAVLDPPPLEEPSPFEPPSLPTQDDSFEASDSETQSFSVTTPESDTSEVAIVRDLEESLPEQLGHPTRVAQPTETVEVRVIPQPAPRYRAGTAIGSPLREQTLPGQISNPFHLVIRGPLAENEKQRLFELLQEFDTGISPAEIQNQIQEGRILLPEMTEFFAVHLAGRMRDSQAELTAIPSALWQGFSAHFPETPKESRSPTQAFSNDSRAFCDSDISTNLESPGIPPQDGTLTSDEASDPTPLHEIALIATARFYSLSTDPQRAQELDSLIERLIEQVKQKAKYKRAARLGEIKTEIQPSLTGDSERILVTLPAWVPITPGF